MEFKLDLTGRIRPVKAIWAGVAILIPAIYIFTVAELHSLSITGGLVDTLYGITFNQVSGHASTLGWVLFYLIIIGVPLVGLINLLAVLKIDLKLASWRLSGLVAFQPFLLNIILAIIFLGLGALFDGHLLIDGMACYSGNINACD